MVAARWLKDRPQDGIGPTRQCTNQKALISEDIDWPDDDAVVVGVDVLFFRHRLWERLMVNIGIVLVFATFYLRFLKRA